MSDEIIALANALQELHEKWEPLPWHIPVGQALFYRGAKEIGAQCGRSSGKTELIAYCNWRWAKENPGSENYIVEPFYNQGKEILWASQRIQSFGPEDWIDKINETEARITFTNGSFIKLEGADRPDKLRGIKPKGLISYDELKDCRYSAIQAMEPNRARYNVPALYAGTPPEFHNHYVDIMESCKDKMKKNKKGFWAQVDSYQNPYNSKEWLDSKHDDLKRTGNEEEWLREYMALFVRGGKRAIFPQFLKINAVTFESLNLLLKEYVLIVGFDPAATSVFGVLYVLFHPMKRHVIVFDEEYIDEPEEMTSRKVFARTNDKTDWLKEKVKERRWVYDAAAAYFRSEINEIPESDWWLESVNKSEFGIEGHINIVRSVMNKGLLKYTSNCEKFKWEMENYVKDEKGRVPDKHDHLINVLEYILVALGFSLDEVIEQKKDSDMGRRAYSLEEDLRNMGGMGFREI
jgi:hypothetical protein